MQISNTEYNLLFSVYGLPNIALPFISGYLVDRIGSQ